MLYAHMVLDWLGIGFDYVLAAAFIVGGLYLATSFPIGILRFVGMALFAFGCVVAAYTFGRTGGLLEGGANKEAEWLAKNHAAQIARLEQERDAKSVAAETAASQAAQLAIQNGQIQGQVNDYAVSISQLSDALRACRRATADDDRRMYDIIGRPSVAGKHPK
jgi:hypothetical protein